MKLQIYDSESTNRDELISPFIVQIKEPFTVFPFCVSGRDLSLSFEGHLHCKCFSMTNNKK